MATTINAANISVGFDAKKLKEGTTLARSEIAQLTRNLKDSVPPVAKLQKQQEALYAAFRAGAITNEQYTRTLSHLDAKVDALNPSMLETVKNAKNLEAAWVKASGAVGKYTAATRQALEGTTKVSAATMAAVNKRSGGGMFGELAMIAGSRAGLAGGAAGLIAGAAGGAVRAQMEAEKAITTFSVLTGSIERGTAAFQQMRQISQTSPIRLQDLQQAGQTMLAFGVAADDLIPTLKQIGDITGGDSLRFQMLSLAFAQSSAAGRLMGQDLLQMVNAGFNPLQVISQQTGKSIAELRKEMENGLITFDMVAGAFESATAQGGKFNGMLAAQSETISGQWRAVMGQLNNVMLQVGETIGPVLVVGMKSAQGVLMTVNAGVQKLREGVGFVYSGLLDIVTLDFDGTNTNAYLDSLKEAENSANAIGEAREKEKQNVEAIVSGYKEIANAAELRLTLEEKLMKVGDEYEALINKNFETIQKLTFGEENFLRIQREGAGWTKEQLDNLERQESIIKSMTRQKSMAEEKAKSDAELKKEAEKQAEKMRRQEEADLEKMKQGPSGSNSFKAGTMEAYKQAFSGQKRFEEQQLRVQIDQLKVQKQLVDKIGNIQTVRPYR